MLTTMLFDENKRRKAAAAAIRTQQKVDQCMTENNSCDAGHKLNRCDKVLDDLLLSERRYIDNMQVCEKERGTVVQVDNYSPRITAVHLQKTAQCHTSFLEQVGATQVQHGDSVS